MFYKFPIIEHLDQVREAIEGRDEFIIAEREWGYVANYLVNLIDTFPYPNTKDDVLNEHYKIRRECRGIKFGLDGKTLARPFHKFHNLGEKPETQMERVNFDLPFINLEKLDGSMIHPIVVNDKVSLCTKMGITDVATPVQEYAERQCSYDTDGTAVDTWYMDFMYDLAQSGLTPLFEWCSRKQRIVVDYGENDHLVLTAIRGNINGEYKTYDQMVALAEPYYIPYVERWEGTFEGIQKFVEMVQEKEGEEGCVIRFDNGHMLKIKNPWYLQLHKTKELLQFEKDVWALVLDEKQDDAKAFMEQEDKDRIDAFAADLYGALDATVERLKWEVIAWVDNNGDSQKKFAVEFVNGKDAKWHHHERGLLFKIKNDIDGARDIVYDYVRLNLGSSTKVDDIRFMANNIVWGDY